MPSKFAEVTPSGLNPMSIPGLSSKGRDAVNAAFDAMSTWRNEIAEANERNGHLVIEKLAAAAAALGWPEQIVDAAEKQMQSINEMQIKTMDQMMDAWEEQLKLRNPMAGSPSAVLSKLKSLPSFGQTGGWPGMDQLQKAAMNPMQFWAQVAEQWQKSWADTMTFWNNPGKPH